MFHNFNENNVIGRCLKFVYDLVYNVLCIFSYKQVLRVWLLTRSLSFVVAGGSVTALLIYDDLKTTHFQIFMVLIVVINLFGAVGVLSTLAGTILIEREW